MLTSTAEEKEKVTESHETKITNFTNPWLEVISRNRWRRERKKVHAKSFKICHNHLHYVSRLKRFCKKNIVCFQWSFFG